MWSGEPNVFVVTETEIRGAAEMANGRLEVKGEVSDLERPGVARWRLYSDSEGGERAEVGAVWPLSADAECLTYGVWLCTSEEELFGSLVKLEDCPQPLETGSLYRLRPGLRR
ncbi:hypothetical protein V5F50_19870 [Xanthobacter sp. V13C-7B]|uniref:hypothetical protein n=1 Tax=Xanthobacter variabilis TaxID=3119932 RepID=UPI0037280C05